jgi:hypothetical protein
MTTIDRQKERTGTSFCCFQRVQFANTREGWYLYSPSYWYPGAFRENCRGGWLVLLYVAYVDQAPGCLMKNPVVVAGGVGVPDEKSRGGWRRADNEVILTHKFLRPVEFISRAQKNETKKEHTKSHHNGSFESREAKAWSSRLTLAKSSFSIIGPSIIIVEV